MGTRGETVTPKTAVRTYRRRGALVVGAAALMSAAVACGSSSSSGSGSSSSSTGATATTNTTVLLDWFPNPDHIALYLAQKDGDFTKHHLNVTFQSPSNSTDALKLVSLGQVPLAISYEPETIVAATNNPPLNITAVAAMIPTSLNSLIISGKSGVASPAGLAGKTVGTDGDPTSAQMLKAVLKKYNMSLSQIKLVTVNEGLVPAMVSNKVAAIISGYRNVEGIQLASLGLNPKVYPVSTQGVPNYDELVIIANKSKLASDAAYRTMVKEFLAGLALGASAAQASPAAALTALTPVAKGYSPALLKKMVYATTPLLKNPAGFGAMSVSQWQSFANWMKGDGLISKQIQASAVVNTSLLPKS
jgi:putative hydroxymethylpyrimidine transport system substrate-binding protein